MMRASPVARNVSARRGCGVYLARSSWAMTASRAAAQSARRSPSTLDTRATGVSARRMAVPGQWDECPAAVDRIAVHRLRRARPGRPRRPRRTPRLGRRQRHRRLPLPGHQPRFTPINPLTVVDHRRPGPAPNIRSQGRTRHGCTRPQKRPRCCGSGSRGSAERRPPARSRSPSWAGICASPPPTSPRSSRPGHNRPARVEDHVDAGPSPDATPLPPGNDDATRLDRYPRAKRACIPSR